MDSNLRTGVWLGLIGVTFYSLGTFIAKSDNWRAFWVWIGIAFLVGATAFGIEWRREVRSDKLERQRAHEFQMTYPMKELVPMIASLSDAQVSLILNQMASLRLKSDHTWDIHAWDDQGVERVLSPAWVQKFLQYAQGFYDPAKREWPPLSEHSNKTTDQGEQQAFLNFMVTMGWSVRPGMGRVALWSRYDPFEIEEIYFG